MNNQRTHDHMEFKNNKKAWIAKSNHGHMSNQSNHGLYNIQEHGIKPKEQ